MNNFYKIIFLLYLVISTTNGATITFSMYRKTKNCSEICEPAVALLNTCMPLSGETVIISQNDNILNLW